MKDKIQELQNLKDKLSWDNESIRVTLAATIDATIELLEREHPTRQKDVCDRLDNKEIEL